jgi:DNA repair photolyase
MKGIYTPRGKAREYSPLALNLYTGCNHGCIYCFAPDIVKEERDKYLEIKPVKDIIKILEQQLKSKRFEDQVLMSFMSDPYNSLNDELKLTRKALELLLRYKIPTAILTKAGFKAFQDWDTITAFGPNIKMGATLTFDNWTDSTYYEPHAASWSERLTMLRVFKEKGIRTFASFEPVFAPKQALHLIELGLPYIDFFKVGKLNHFPEIEKKIDWTAFLENVVALLRGKANFYIKEPLREAAPNVKLFPEEINSDMFALKGWK